MAKKLKRVAAFGTALVMCTGMMTIPAFAKGGGGHGSGHGGGQGGGFGQSSSENEWYEVYVQGELVASDADTTHDVLWLGQTYVGDATVEGTELTWYIKTNNGSNGDYSGSVDLTQYIEIPEGFEVDKVEIETKQIEGDNSMADQYDNAVINVSIKTLYNPVTGETIEVPTNPPATEPPATEPPATEHPATEPPATEHPATEPPATEPPATEPPATEPPATEPPATEPPATEPPATEPPATEPPATEPPATEPPATEPPATEPPATEPPATEPPAPQNPAPQQDHGVALTNDDGLIDIFDEDVPLADVPKTGDISTLWMALSSLSAGGLILLNKKRKS